MSQLTRVLHTEYLIESSISRDGIVCLLSCDIMFILDTSLLIMSYTLHSTVLICADVRPLWRAVRHMEQVDVSTFDWSCRIGWVGLSVAFDIFSVRVQYTARPVERPAWRPLLALTACMHSTCITAARQWPITWCGVADKGVQSGRWTSSADAMLDIGNDYHGQVDLHHRPPGHTTFAAIGFCVQLRIRYNPLYPGAW